MPYCNALGCTTKIDDEAAQERHDEVFPNNCGVCGCFNGSSRNHILKRKHRTCGLGDCTGKNITFGSDAAVRRHWNDYHRNGDAMILVDRFGKNLDSGYESDGAGW